MSDSHADREIEMSEIQEKIDQVREMGERIEKELNVNAGLLSEAEAIVEGNDWKMMNNREKMRVLVGMMSYGCLLGTMGVLVGVLVLFLWVG